MWGAYYPTSAWYRILTSSWYYPFLETGYRIRWTLGLILYGNSLSSFPNTCRLHGGRLFPRKHQGCNVLIQKCLLFIGRPSENTSYVSDEMSEDFLLLGARIVRFQHQIHQLWIPRATWPLQSDRASISRKSCSLILLNKLQSSFWTWWPLGLSIGFPAFGILHWTFGTEFSHPWTYLLPSLAVCCILSEPSYIQNLQSLLVLEVHARP